MKVKNRVINKLLVLSLLWILLSSSIIAQVVNNSKITIESFPKIHAYFLECNESKQSEYTGVDTVHAYDNDEIITIVFLYENGENIKTVGYYSNNQKYREINYLHGQLDGRDEKWYKDGNKEALVYYNKGNRYSPIITWYDNGKIQSVYDLNEKSNKGCIISWYKNGNIYQETFAIDSTLNGFIEKEYYENGLVKRIEIANLGKQEYTTYHDNGQVAWSGMIINAIWSQVGHWQEWHENGTLKREYYFNDSIPNQKEGIWKWWDENGNFIKQELYKDGIMIEEKQSNPLFPDNG